MPICNFDSDVPFNIELKRDSTEVNSQITVDFTGSKLKFKKFIDKSTDYPLEMKIDLVKREGKRGSEVRVKELRLNSATSQTGVKGVYNLKSGSFVLSAESKKLLIYDIAALSPFIESTGKTRGFIGFNIKAVRGSSKSQPLYKGVVSVSNAGLHLQPQYRVL